MTALPSELTKEGYHKCGLKAMSISLSFAESEATAVYRLSAALQPGGSSATNHARAGRNRWDETMVEAKASRLKGRPLSPHLQIYRLTLTMAMSIVHRLTGAALYFGMLLLVWWLIAAAAGPNAYASVQWFMETLVGRLILLGYTWALIHHMLGGIRHLIWDMGYGFGPAEREWLTAATLVGSVGLTVVLWFVGYLFMGGVR
jgi:succinate dehydrogenase / fumarate reductase cytochrome b subunit